MGSSSPLESKERLGYSVRSIYRQMAMSETTQSALGEIRTYHSLMKVLQALDRDSR